jgi:hypothetical protein
MTKLLFTADGLLREQALGAESRVLSHVVEGPDGAAERLLAGEREYEIVPLAQGGWGFELHDAHGARSGGFQPFRLRRGGRLRVLEVGMSLHGRPWSHEGWAFSLPDGRRVDATVATADQLTSNGNGTTAGAADATVRDASPGSSVVVLEAVTSLRLIALAEVLALGSWLIARWHMAPAVDHVLASAAAGTGLAGGGSAKPAPAGIRAQTAN